MHASMHYHMTKYAQWSRKIIKICSIKFQFYFMLHFYFFWNNAQLFSANSLHLKFVHLFDCTFLNIENDPSKSQEVAGAYLSEEIWGKVRSSWKFSHFRHKIFPFASSWTPNQVFNCLLSSAYLFLPHPLLHRSIATTFENLQ